MSVHRYDVRLTVEGAHVAKWAKSEVRITDIRSGPSVPYLTAFGPLANGLDGMSATFDVRTYAPSAIAALHNALTELHSNVPGMRALQAQHDENALVEVERLR